MIFIFPGPMDEKLPGLGFRRPHRIDSERKTSTSAQAKQPDTRCFLDVLYELYRQYTALFNAEEIGLRPPAGSILFPLLSILFCDFLIEPFTIPTRIQNQGDSKTHSQYADKALILCCRDGWPQQGSCCCPLCHWMILLKTPSGMSNGKRLLSKPLEDSL